MGIVYGGKGTEQLVRTLESIQLARVDVKAVGLSQPQLGTALGPNSRVFLIREQGAAQGVELHLFIGNAVDLMGKLAAFIGDVEVLLQIRQGFLRQITVKNPVQHMEGQPVCPAVVVVRVGVGVELHRRVVLFVADHIPDGPVLKIVTENKIGLFPLENIIHTAESAEFLCNDIEPQLNVRKPDQVQAVRQDRILRTCFHDLPVDKFLRVGKVRNGMSVGQRLRAEVIVLIGQAGSIGRRKT